MNNEIFADLIQLFCECLTKEDRSDFMTLTDTDISFCNQYISLYDKKYFDSNKNALILKETTKKYLMSYFRSKLESEIEPFLFFEESSIQQHIDAINRKCLAFDGKKPLHNIFRESIPLYITEEYYTFKNMSLQIISKIESYHHNKDIEEADERNKRDEKLQNQLSNFQSTISTNTTEANRHYKELASNISQTQKKIYETSMVILGIFASIVLVFNASVSFYSATVGFFTESSIYKISFILIVVGIIFAGVIMGLFSYLESIRLGSEKDIEIKPISEESTSNAEDNSQTENNSQSENCDNIATYCEKHDNISLNKEYRLFVSRAKNICFDSRVYRPFIITLCVLLILLICVLGAWAFGLVERRNAYIESSTTTETTQPVNDNEKLGQIYNNIETTIADILNQTEAIEK